MRPPYVFLTWMGTALVSAIAAGAAAAQQRTDLNNEIMETVRWLAKNKAGLGYDLGARYTEDLKYGEYTFRSTGGTKTMCVAAVFEILVRTLATETDTRGIPVSSKLLPGSLLNGSSALHLAPYIYQYKATVNLPEYERNYSAGAGDAFVLFGIGRYVGFDEAKPGDFVYFNRHGKGGHAAVFIDYLDGRGTVAKNGASASGFRYFSAQQGGTNGMGYRDAFFGACPPVKTLYKQDCGIIRSTKRTLFSMSRLLPPADWFVSYSAIRVDRFFKGHSIDQIAADEASFRKRATVELEEANRKAKAAARKGLFPLIAPPIAAEEKQSREDLSEVVFDELEFGPAFVE